jgi:hypothetical protein
LRPCWKVVLNSRDLIEWNPRRRSQSHVSLRRTEKRTPQSPRFLRPCSKLVLSALCSPSALTNASSELDRSPFPRDGSGNCLRLARVQAPFAAVAVLTRPDPRYLFPPSRPTDCFAIVYPGRALCPSSPRQRWAALFTHRPTDCFANRLPRDAPFSQVAMARRRVRRSVRTESRADQVGGAEQRQGHAVTPSLKQGLARPCPIILSIL